MARIDEMMRKFGIQDYKVRLWIAGSLPSIEFRAKKLAFEAAFEVVMGKGPKLSEMYRIANAIAAVKDINAVEVTDANGDGHLVYPEWP